MKSSLFLNALQLIAALPNSRNAKVRVLVIGQGIAGSSAVYELAQKGIGNQHTPGASGATGILVVDSNPDNVCGIIAPVDYAEISSGVAAGAFTAYGAPNPGYRPFRTTVAAQRINIATQPSMRCLANEISLPLYFSPWATEYRLNGYTSFSARFNCARNYNGNSSSESGCRQACNEGFPGDTKWIGSKRDCDANRGSAELARQTNDGSGLYNGSFAYNLWNFDSKKNGNKGTNLPEDEWYGWALGYANFNNPTTNYNGNGQAYNGASTLPFNPNDVTQDHPRHQCLKFRDLYSMYQYYLGPDYASYICDVNSGFRGDCTHGVDACSYIGSKTELSVLQWSYLQADEGYPVGSMTEICSRQLELAKLNKQGVKVDNVNGEAILSIDVKANGVYVSTTSKGRVIESDEIILGAPPSAISAMTGSVIDSLKTQEEFESPNAIGVVTFVMRWKSTTVNAKWAAKIKKNMWASYRVINRGSCTNRIELQNTPYHSGDMIAVRVTYTDDFCIKNLLQLAKIEDPNLNRFTPQSGFPINSILAQEELRELRQIFAGNLKHQLMIRRRTICYIQRWNYPGP
jgi:hypothetical protein